MSTDPQSYFRTQAKGLLRLVRSEEPHACNEVRNLYRRFTETSDADLAKQFGLMQAQHMVARRHGFSKWSELLTAPPDAVDRAIAAAQQAATGEHVADDMPLTSDALADPFLKELEAHRRLFENPLLKELEANRRLFEDPVLKELEDNRRLFEDPVLKELEDNRRLFEDPVLKELEDNRRLFENPLLKELEAVTDMRAFVADKAFTVDTKAFAVDTRAFTVDTKVFAVEKPYGVEKMAFNVGKAFAVENQAFGIDKSLTTTANAFADLLKPVEHLKVPSWINEAREMAERMNPIPKFMRDQMELLERMNPIPKAMRDEMELVERMRAKAKPDFTDDE
jgi:hypothetical protein